MNKNREQLIKLVAILLDRRFNDRLRVEALREYDRLTDQTDFSGEYYNDLMKVEQLVVEIWSGEDYDLPLIEADGTILEPTVDNFDNYAAS